MASNRRICMVCGTFGKWKRVCSMKCSRKSLDKAIKYRIKMGWYSTCSKK